RTGAFDSSAVAKPAYCRIVHRRPRYIVGWIPRVKGNSPGNPSSLAGSHPARSRGVRTAEALLTWPIVARLESFCRRKCLTELRLGVKLNLPTGSFRHI